MDRFCLFMLPILSLPLLAGCQGTYDRADFGEAVRRNVEAQIVNPDPVWEPGPPPLDATRAGLALDRYRFDTVEEPEPLSTTTVGGD